MRSWMLIALVVACSPQHSGTPGDGNDDATADAFAGPYPDFPASPIVDSSAPPNSGTLFGGAGTGSASGGPCMYEPEVGTLYPQNWLRPRFSWAAGGSENLFEVRVTAANEVNPLVVYTAMTTWTMPADIWSALSNHIIEQPITVTVRGATYDGSSMLTSGPEIGTSGDIQIASVSAPGAIVYWTTSNGTGFRGFHIGDESVVTVAAPSDDGAATQCIGCHSSTPDGTYVAYSATDTAGNGDPAMLGLMSSDGMHTKPPFISAAAMTLMQRLNQEAPQFSKNHWQTGDHVAINMYPTDGVTDPGAYEIMWTDLEATSTATGTGYVARTGDANHAASASFAHTSDTILYVSAPAVNSGVTVSNGDIWTVPYNNRAGGAATAVTGASTADNEYYPSFSPDDKYIAYDVVPGGSSSYANPSAEVYVIASSGGTRVRLAANDPPTCTNQGSSPGVENSWPKWAPQVSQGNSKTYYWLTFSSTRNSPILGPTPQLYVTPIVDDGTTLTTYPALYLWNQPSDEHNHTPAWDFFEILQ
ncbi:MAG TPA: hypothetical protein VH143_23730 [Kofleriaceae bacterium]|nr:hypothetical protein [Kofleriaceae bacterium]